MTTETETPNTNNNQIISLALVKNKKNGQDQEATSDCLLSGLDTFSTLIKQGASGFFALVFDEKGANPQIIWAGDIDPISSIGALEFAKSEFIKNLQAVFDEVEV